MPKDNSKAARERRRADAEQRQAERNTRSPQEQLALIIGGRPGRSLREGNRLTALLPDTYGAEPISDARKRAAKKKSA